MIQPEQQRENREKRLDRTCRITLMSLEAQREKMGPKNIHRNIA